MNVYDSISGSCSGSASMDLHGKGLPSEKCSFRLFSKYCSLASLSPATGKIGGRSGDGVAPCFSKTSSLSSLSGPTRTATLPGASFVKQKCWNLVIPLKGLNMVSRWDCQSIHCQENMTTLLSPHDEFVTSSTSWSESTSEDRNFFFNEPKYPSTAHLVCQTLINESSIELERPTAHLQSI